MNNYKKLLDIFHKELFKLFMYEDEFHAKIYEAMKYSLSSGGKRVRPLLCMLTFLELEKEEHLAKVIPYAIAIEFVHTYSLIHDDLPAMDDDDMRRGKPTNHKMFSEGIAILAGDGLLNMAAEILCKHLESITDSEELRRGIRAMHYLFHAAGIHGMIGGQMMDIDFPAQKYTKEICESMYSMKTGALIKASVITAAIVAGADDETLANMGEFAACIGLAYQLEDDILDGMGDDQKEEINMLKFMSEEELHLEIQNLTERGYLSLGQVKLKRNLLQDFAQKLVDRRY